MKKLTRRDFLKSVSAGGLVLLGGIPAMSWGANANVVVVGGGTGGATFAKYLKKADPEIQVTLIEKNADYHTCYMSNEVLSGDRALDSLRFTYDRLRENYGINVVQDEVTNIDPITKTVIGKNGQYAYDRCVVSPGIDFRFDLIDGYDAALADNGMPHAWKAGQQTVDLRNQVAAMPSGGTFVLAAPPNPYRCPPAPYERVSQVAHYFKQANPSAKILILDPKMSFAKQGLFEQAWFDLYDGMIERHSGGEYQVVGLNAASKTLETADGSQYSADVINIIPPQKAGAIAFAAGLTDDSGWCPIDPKTFESTLISDIHVIGDSSNSSPLPKSGFAANSEAKACALAIAALLNDREPGRTSFTNGCYSVVGTDYAISIVAGYELSEDGRMIEKVGGGMSPTDATADERKIDVDYAYSWYNNFTRDVFY